MTFRLVALMSGVLLLTLAAFGFLINQYQDQVLQEVAHTASEVGRATLRTIDFASSHPAVDSNEEGFVFWQGSAGNYDDVAIDVEAAEPGAAPRHGAVVVTATAMRTEVLDPIEGQEIDPETNPRTRQVGTEVNFFFDLESIRAESDPARGIVLKIPRLAADEDAMRGRAEFTRVADGRTTQGLMARREEISLPVSVTEFRELFDTIRGRSLFLFFGVFLVGAVLTTGLATRFMRPIRRLDAGIRRLSDGDLDVEVEVHGKDEIARLSRAFNEMTRKLRDNRERSREVVRREKLSALGRLAAGVAHDVRNPLHSIGLTLQHLNETARPEDPQRLEDFERSVETIRGEIHRLDGLIGNFLSFARSERRPRTSVDLAGLIEETVRLVSKEAEWRKVEIDLDLAGDLPRIEADGEALRSSLLNLVLNSFEAMPEGGRLGINLARRDGEVVLEITDTGIGIPREEQDRVFEFAYTTREGGNGLGLAMVHHCIVEEHGGRVGLESREGHGTCVRLALPAADGAAA